MRQSVGQTHLGLANPVQQSLFELTIGVDINRKPGAGKGSICIFAEIKTRNGSRVFCAPVSSAQFAALVLVDFDAGGGQEQFARPMKRQVVCGERRSAAKVRVPAFTRADKEHPISRVANHAAVVTKSEFEFV